MFTTIGTQTGRISRTSGKNKTIRLTLIQWKHVKCLANILEWADIILYNITAFNCIIKIAHPLDQHHMGKHHMDKALLDQVQMDQTYTWTRASHAQGSHGPDSDGQDLQMDKAITWPRASHGHNSDRPDPQMDKGITWTRASSSKAYTWHKTIQSWTASCTMSNRTAQRAALHCTNQPRLNTLEPPPPKQNLQN